MGLQPTKKEKKDKRDKHQRTEDQAGGPMLLGYDLESEESDDAKKNKKSKKKGRERDKEKEMNEKKSGWFDKVEPKKEEQSKDPAVLAAEAAEAKARRKREMFCPEDDNEEIEKMHVEIRDKSKGIKDKKALMKGMGALMAGKMKNTKAGRRRKDGKP